MLAKARWFVPPLRASSLSSIAQTYPGQPLRARIVNGGVLHLWKRSWRRGIYLSVCIYAHIRARMESPRIIKATHKYRLQRNMGTFLPKDKWRLCMSERRGQMRARRALRSCEGLVLTGI